MSALTQLAGEGRSKEAFLQAMRDATTGMTKLCGPSAPNSVYVTLQEVGLMSWDQTVTVSGLRSLVLPIVLALATSSAPARG